MLYGGGGVITGTNSNEHPRLDSVSNPRLTFNITKSNSLYNHNFICSSLVKHVSIVTVCEPLKKKINDITTNDTNILHSPMIKNIKNINRDNLATINSNCDYKPVRNNNIDTSLPDLNFNEYSTNILPCTQKKNSFPNPFDPSSLINVITVPPKFWRKKPVNKYNPVRYDDVDEDLYVFKSFKKSIKRYRNFTHRPRLELII